MTHNPLGNLDKPNRRWFLISAGLVVLLAVVTLTLMAFVKSSESDKRSLKVANCVNNVLALRQDTSARDSAITVELWSNLGSVLSAPKGQPQNDAYLVFFTALQKDIPVLVADKKFRDTHPLGVC